MRFMAIREMSEAECREALTRARVGRLGCALDGQPYIVPVSIVYEEGYIYCFSTGGEKIEWMRANPKLCLQADEISGQSQ
jgi:uncharacterized protein